jgi:hypothetical protein
MALGPAWENDASNQREPDYSHFPIAIAVIGNRWSGPRFFGLRSRLGEAGDQTGHTGPLRDLYRGSRPSTGSTGAPATTMAFRRLERASGPAAAAGDRRIDIVVVYKVDRLTRSPEPIAGIGLGRRQPAATARVCWHSRKVPIRMVASPCSTTAKGHGSIMVR